MCKLKMYFPAFSGLFRPFPAFSGLFRPFPAFSGLFRRTHNLVSDPRSTEILVAGFE